MRLPIPGYEGRYTVTDDGRVGRNGLRGERIPTAKLTEDQVRTIREVFRPGQSAALARIYGVSPRQIQHIVSGKGWTHLESK